LSFEFFEYRNIFKTKWCLNEILDILSHQCVLDNLVSFLMKSKWKLKTFQWSNLNYAIKIKWWTRNSDFKFTMIKQISALKSENLPETNLDQEPWLLTFLINKDYLNLINKSLNVVSKLNLFMFLMSCLQSRSMDSRHFAL